MSRALGKARLAAEFSTGGPEATRRNETARWELLLGIASSPWGRTFWGDCTSKEARDALFPIVAAR